MFKVLGSAFFYLFISQSLIAQDSPEQAASKLGPNPLFIIDSIRVTKSDLQNFDSNTITSVTMFTDSADIQPFGKDGKDGVVVMETRAFARKNFIRFLRKASLKYDSLYTANGSDSSFCYIMNDKIQKGSYEGNLSLIDDKLFISLEILTPEELITRFLIDDRRYGVVIKSNTPSNLYNKEEKF